VNTGIPNLMFTNGCTMSDEIIAASDDADHHGAFVSAIAHIGNAWRDAGTITDDQRFDPADDGRTLHRRQLTPGSDPRAGRATRSSGAQGSAVRRPMPLRATLMEENALMTGTVGSRL
jgi:hypothetical protein